MAEAPRPLWGGNWVQLVGASETPVAEAPGLLAAWTGPPRTAGSIFTPSLETDRY